MLNHRQTIADGFRDCILADAFHLFCSSKSPYTCHLNLTVQYYLDYKRKPEQFQYQFFLYLFIEIRFPGAALQTKIVCDVKVKLVVINTQSLKF